MSFSPDTVHGLSADVYYDGEPVRVFGDVVIAYTVTTLPLTANDEGATNPIDDLRRADQINVTVPITDTLGDKTLSGIMWPFATVVSGDDGDEIHLVKSKPGDSYRDKAKELRLVARDGSRTFIFPQSVAVEFDDLAMSEENQQVLGATFRTYFSTVSGEEVLVRAISGSITP